MFLRFFTISLFAMSQTALADALDVNLNNNTAAFKYSASVRSLNKANSEIHVGALYNDSKNTFADIGVLVKGENNSVPGMSIGVGVKALTGSIHYGPFTRNMSAIAIGGEVGYTIPTAKQIAIVGEYFAGPKITTFGDAERFNQFGLRLEYEVIPQTRAYIGYREINFGIKANDSSMLDSGWHAGVRISF